MGHRLRSDRGVGSLTGACLQWLSAGIIEVVWLISVTASHPSRCRGRPLWREGSPGLARFPMTRTVPQTAGVPRPAECELTILMPCLNEARTLRSCIGKAREFLASAGVSGEVLVADNGSTDGSQALAIDCGAHVIDVPRRGYGAALIAGIAEARGRFVVMGDSDESYDFSALAPMVTALREGYQLVMGDRFAGGIKPGAMPALHRYLGNPVLSFLGRLFFSVRIRDFHCGLRGFDRDAIRSLGLSCEGMEFASEMVVKAALQKLKVTQVPVTLYPDGRDRPPHLRSWRDGWRHLRFLLLFSPAWLFLYPGALMLVLGAVIQAMLLRGPISMFGASFDIHTMLFSAASVIIGAQLVTFATFSKVFLEERGLHPETPLVVWIRRYLKLETALVAGLGLVLSGLLVSALAVFIWERTRFGALDPTVGMRVVIPALTLTVVGAQVMLAGMFLSVLGLRTREP